MSMGRDDSASWFQPLYFGSSGGIAQRTSRRKLDQDHSTELACLLSACKGMAISLVRRRNEPQINGNGRGFRGCCSVVANRSECSAISSCSVCLESCHFILLCRGWRSCQLDGLFFGRGCFSAPARSNGFV